MPDTPPPNPQSPKPTPSASKPRSSSSASKQRSSRRHGPAVSPEESQLQNYDLARHKTSRSKRRNEVSQLNLTSMIDVIFLLLIYFVITAKFIEDEGVLIANLPVGTGQEAAPEELPPPNIEIYLTTLHQTGVQIEVGGLSFTNFRDLTAHLMAIQDNPARGRSGFAPTTAPVIIKPAGEVRWAHVVNAFNSGLRAEYSNISFAQSGGQ